MPFKFTHSRCGCHQRKQHAQAIELLVAVMKVVDEPYVVRLSFVQDGHLVFRFSVPTAVIVEANTAIELARFGRDRIDGLGGQGQPFGLGQSLERLFAHGDPQIARSLIAAQSLQSEADRPAQRIVRVDTAAPPGRQLDVVLAQCCDLVVEARDMLVSIVVGDRPQSQTSQHRCALGRAAFRRVEWHDAPGDQVRPRENAGIRQRIGHGQLPLTRTGGATCKD